MRFASLLVALLFAAPAWAQTQIYQQSFEDGDPALSTSIPQFSDGDADFFARTDFSNVGSGYVVTGFDGSFVFAAQDIDGEGAENPATLFLNDIDISGFENLSFSGLFAEDDDGTSQDWDAPDYVHVKYRIDSDLEEDLVDLLWFENDGSTFNSAPFEDTDFDGTGDGTELTSAFAEFTKAIAGTGSTLDIVIVFSLDSGDEDIAVDNIRITGTAVATPEPEIDVTPLALDFGAVDVGSDADLMVAIANTGDGALSLSSISASGAGFSVVGVAPTSVAAGGSEMVTVRFSPAAAGPATGTLTIASDDADEGSVEVSLSGTGQEVVVPEPEIDVTPTSVDFGTVDVGASAQETVTITNIGDAPLAISSISVSDGGVDLVGSAFSIISGGDAGTLAVDGTRQVVVAFSPSAAGPAVGTLTITSDDADEGTVQVSLSGTGEEVVVPEPEIDVTPLALDFGSVDVGSSADLMVTIANTGDGALSLASITASGAGFSVVGTAPTSVAAGGSEMVTVRFAPGAAGPASGTLTIASDDADEASVEVSLSGTGNEVDPGECSYAFRAVSLVSTDLPSSGGQLRFKFEIDNSEGLSAANVDVWAVVSDGTQRLVIGGPRTPSVASGDIYRAGFYQRVPAFVADGMYTYTLFAGDFDAEDHGGSVVCGSEEFLVTKGNDPAKAGSAGPLVSEDWADVEIQALDLDQPESQVTVEGDEVRVGPNPVRDRAAFTFALEAGATVRLAVYDTRGREVAVLVDGQLATGQHTATLREDLPAGVYVWRLAAGDRVQTGRITVVR